MDLETNGVVEPEEAIRFAARVLVQQLSVFADLESTPFLKNSHKYPKLTRYCYVLSMTWSLL